MAKHKEKSQVATCKHCGKVTDIGLSKAVREMSARNLTQKEYIRILSDNFRRIHGIKNGQIMAMHRSIAQLMDLMTKAQRTKASKICQSLRDDMRKAFKTQMKNKNG